VASRKVKDLKTSLDAWYKARVEKAAQQVRDDAKKFKEDVIESLQGREKKTKLAAHIEATTTNTNRSAPTSPGQTSKNPKAAMDQYINSIIIDDEGAGVDVVQTVRIENPLKKDETTGMTMGKIAKAIEFGNSTTAPRPAWRRAQAKVRATGNYRKKL